MKVAFLRFSDGAATVQCEEGQYERWCEAAETWDMDFNPWAKWRLVSHLRSLDSGHLARLETIRQVAGPRQLSAFVRGVLDKAAAADLG